MVSGIKRILFFFIRDTIPCYCFFFFLLQIHFQIWLSHRRRRKTGELPQTSGRWEVPDLLHCSLWRGVQEIVRKIRKTFHDFINPRISPESTNLPGVCEKARLGGIDYPSQLQSGPGPLKIMIKQVSAAHHTSHFLNQIFLRWRGSRKARMSVQFSGLKTI